MDDWGFFGFFNLLESLLSWGGDRKADSLSKAAATPKVVETSGSAEAEKVIEKTGEWVMLISEEQFEAYYSDSPCTKVLVVKEFLDGEWIRSSKVVDGRTQATIEASKQYETWRQKSSDLN